MPEIILNNKFYLNLKNNITANDAKIVVHEHTGIPLKDFYLLTNGKRLNGNDTITANIVHVMTRLCGGKGGFGSMLRAIGAQIEKTTNREACRDLSGRRLRDINEEKRLKKWIEAQAEREREAEDRKLKKIERLCQKPKHEFKDDNYDRERQQLPEKVVDAVEHGWKAGAKRKEQPAKAIVKKRPKLWLDADVEDELSSSNDEDSENEEKSSNITSEPEKVVSEASCSSKSNEKNESTQNNEDKTSPANDSNEESTNAKNLPSTSRD